jgi:16S rRNA processing protein RimM
VELVRIAPGRRHVNVGLQDDPSKGLHGRAVRALAGVILEADVDVSAPGGDPDQFHDLALVGLSVTAPDGSAIGSVVGVIHLPGQDLLEIAATGSTGEPFLVPFVHALVPVVDLAAGVLVVDLPAGLVADGDGGDLSG